MFQICYKYVKLISKHKCMSTEFFKCNIGFRQGKPLSLLLFSLYNNDLENDKVGLHNITGAIDNDLFYADDTLVISESVGDLQSVLNEFGTYCT